MYQLLAQRYGLEWKRRDYDPEEWGSGDVVNRCVSAATACLYGITEAAVLATGYAPAVGFIHTGKPRSFAYDIADLFKFNTVEPEKYIHKFRTGSVFPTRVGADRAVLERHRLVAPALMKCVAVDLDLHESSRSAAPPRLSKTG